MVFGKNNLRNEAEIIASDAYSSFKNAVKCDIYQQEMSLFTLLGKCIRFHKLGDPLFISPYFEAFLKALQRKKAEHRA